MAKQLLQDGKRELVILACICNSTYLIDCRKAKLLLKKKRYLEGLLDQTDTQMDNLAQLVVIVLLWLLLLGSIFGRLKI